MNVLNNIIIILTIVIILILLTYEHFNVYVDMINDANIQFNKMTIKNLSINDKNIIDYLYPIGSVYLSNTINDDPNIKFKNTKWILNETNNEYHFYLMNTDKDVGKYDGEKDQTIKADHLPKHTHNYRYAYETISNTEYGKYNPYLAGDSLTNENTNSINYTDSDRTFFPRYHRFYIWDRIE